MNILNPINNTVYDSRINSLVSTLGEAVGKRVGGGRVQFGLMSFSEIAEVLVNNNHGFDKQLGRGWEGKHVILSRYLDEYRLPYFSQAIVIAFVEKYVEDPADGFRPLGAGSRDIEASLEAFRVGKDAEMEVWGEGRDPYPEFSEAVTGKLGLATEYGNGDSLEFIIPCYTPGVWREIRDVQFERPTGMIIISKYIEVSCTGMDVNGLTNGLPPQMSVKLLEAVKIARQLCVECNIF